MAISGRVLTLTERTVAGLPNPESRAGQPVMVTDGASVGDVSTGGGSRVVPAINDGAGAWAVLARLDDFQYSLGLKLASDLTISNNSNTQVPWDAEAFDNGFGHSIASSQEQITIPVPGLYGVVIRSAWEASSAGQRRMSLTNDAGTVQQNLVLHTPATTGADVRCGFGAFVASAGDVYEIQAFQDSGGDLDLLSGVNAACYFFLIHHA